MKFASNLLFIDIDFCKPKVIQGLRLKFLTYIYYFLRGA